MRANDKSGDRPEEQSGGTSLLPSIIAPKGGGSIRGMGEKFSTDSVTGGCSLRIPIAMSRGRNGFTPQLDLSYNSGAGNDAFGLGTRLTVPKITRKTDKGTPRYIDAPDAADADIFVLSDAEDLVPVRTSPEVGAPLDAFDSGEYRVQRYRPRVDGLFARVERWTERATGISHWRSTTKDNVLSVYGRTTAARITDPEDPTRIFSWLLEETRDDLGRVVQYVYKAEDGAGVSNDAPSESSRFRKDTTFIATAQRYLKRVRYGNRAPVASDALAPAEPSAWLFEVVFDYGEHDPSTPTPDETRRWLVRVDPFSTFRPSFDVRTYRLCQRILMFHRFAELGETPCLVKSTDFAYAGSHVRSASDPAYDGGVALTHLASVTHAGYVRGTDGTYTRETLPPLQLAFSQPVIHDEARAITRRELAGIPGTPDAQWIDLDGEGLPGLLAATPYAWRFQANLGDGQLAAPTLERSLPSPSELLAPSTQLVDLDGDGGLDLVHFGPPVSGYFARTADRDWGRFAPLHKVPNIDWSDPNLRFVDLDGDGFPDILITEHETLRWYRSLGADGFEPARNAPKPKDERDGPAVVFADGTETIQLADMSGDGLVDLVRIRNGEVCYWPNLGTGQFGRRITLDGVRPFDTPDEFAPSRVHLGDLDGSGTSDIIYAGRAGTQLYFNLAGNALSPPLTITSLPVHDSLSRFAVVDLLGHGTACVVWSTTALNPTSPLAFVDLLADGKPHLLASMTNNLGGETLVSYAPSTRFYLADKAAGRPWITRLPFPVHVIERVEHIEHVTSSRLTSRFSYHHGFFDGYEREFRGFALVEKWDTESFSTDDPAHELDVPPVHTKTWFHTGAWLERERLDHLLADEFYAGDPSAPSPGRLALPAGLTTREEREAARALRGQMLREETYAEDGTSASAHPYVVTQRSVAVRLIQHATGNAHAVFFAHPEETLTMHYERDPQDPRVVQDVALDVDDYGNVLRTCTIAYPRRTPAHPEQGRPWATLTEATFVNRADQSAWYRAGVLVEKTTSEITGLSLPPSGVLAIEAVRAAITAIAEIPFEATPSGALERRTFGRQRHIYYRDDLAGALPLGTIESRALPYQALRVAFTPGLLTGVFAQRIDNSVLLEGGYVLQDGLWWLPSSRAVFDPTRFYLPVQSIDPFSQGHRVTYDSYSLLAVDLQDPLGGHVSVGDRDTSDQLTSNGNDYRVLAPALVTDVNRNRTAVAFDALGLPVAIALMGKRGTTEGDTLADPTIRIDYDVHRWQTSGGTQPVVVHTTSREQHGQSNTRWNELYVYTDGFGRDVMKKGRAEPGPLPALAIPLADPRWVGTGRVVFDNKGNPIKKFEPYFSTTSGYESDPAVVQQGVTPLLHYDPLGRLIRTEYPDGTITKVIFDGWRQESWDQNDAVQGSGWLARMQAGTAAQTRAATLALAHANTPTVSHLDPLGRVFLTIADAGPAGLRPSRVELDIQNNARQTTDPRGIVVLEQLFDVLGRLIQTITPDAGGVRSLADVVGKQLRRWCARDYRHRWAYDELRRLTHCYVQLATHEWLAERTVWGNSIADAAVNARGRTVGGFDESGAVVDVIYDFKGNQLRATRKLATSYRTDLDWMALAGLTDVAALDAAAAPQLGLDAFVTTSVYDALNRVVSRTTPDASEAINTYNVANLLERVDVRVRGSSQVDTFISDIDYNARGQRELIRHGNGTTTVYTYDDKTFQLIGLHTTRDQSGAVLQDLAYTYDAVGNIVQIADAVSYGNAAVSSDGLYEYDPLYQLAKATGREHPGQQPTATDPTLFALDHPADLQALIRYQEQYAYDDSGNLTSVAHVPLDGSSGWTRRYQYATDSNHLLGTSIPGDAPNTFSDAYTHDACGNIASMPHLSQMRWDHSERLQYVNRLGGGEVYFVYDPAGQRVRKVYEHGGFIEERVYLGTLEIYRKRDRVTGGVVLERETLHVMGESARVALVETKTVDTSIPAFTASRRDRYQLANHLRSSLLELDDAAAVITYEEYVPYGGTAFHAGLGTTDVSAKRFRYCGNERDEETGLDYVGARYYAAWLGRWTSPDPGGTSDGLDVYAYCRNNPVTYNDLTGDERSLADLNRFFDTNNDHRLTLLEVAQGLRCLDGVQFHQWASMMEFGSQGYRVDKGLQTLINASNEAVREQMGEDARRLYESNRNSLRTDETGRLYTIATDEAAGERELNRYRDPRRLIVTGVLALGVIFPEEFAVVASFKTGVDTGEYITGRSIFGRELSAAEQDAKGKEALLGWAFIGLSGVSAAIDAKMMFPEGIPSGDGARITRAMRDAMELKKGNIAIAEAQINGERQVLTAVSGGKSTPGTIDLVEEPIFKVKNAGAQPRATDTEVKILEKIAKNLPKDAKGVVNLYTEKKPCFSCRGVIEQFQQMFPNIKLNISYGP